MKQTVVFDFEGVIHSHTSGWKGATIIPDPPVPGIKEAIEKIRQRYYVIVVSSRRSSPEGVTAIMDYLLHSSRGILLERVTMLLCRLKVFRTLLYWNVSRLVFPRVQSRYLPSKLRTPT